MKSERTLSVLALCCACTLNACAPAGRASLPTTDFYQGCNNAVTSHDPHVDPKRLSLTQWDVVSTRQTTLHAADVNFMDAGPTYRPLGRCSVNDQGQVIFTPKPE